VANQSDENQSDRAARRNRQVGPETQKCHLHPMREQTCEGHEPHERCRAAEGRPIRPDRPRQPRRIAEHRAEGTRRCMIRPRASGTSRRSPVGRITRERDNPGCTGNACSSDQQTARVTRCVRLTTALVRCVLVTRDPRSPPTALRRIAPRERKTAWAHRSLRSRKRAGPRDDKRRSGIVRKAGSPGQRNAAGMC